MNVFDERVKFYLKLLISIIAFMFFIYYTHLEVSDPNVKVDKAIFVMLILIMGALLGVDILGQQGGGNGGSE